MIYASDPPIKQPSLQLIWSIPLPMPTNSDLSSPLVMDTIMLDHKFLVCSSTIYARAWAKFSARAWSCPSLFPIIIPHKRSKFPMIFSHKRYKFSMIFSHKRYRVPMALYPIRPCTYFCPSSINIAPKICKVLVKISLINFCNIVEYQYGLSRWHCHIFVIQPPGFRIVRPVKSWRQDQTGPS